MATVIKCDLCSVPVSPLHRVRITCPDGDHPRGEPVTRDLDLCPGCAARVPDLRTGLNIRRLYELVHTPAPA